MAKFIGQSMKRVDAPDKATGKALYAGDYAAENMLHACLVRSEYTHAEILDIDISALPETRFTLYCVIP